MRALSEAIAKWCKDDGDALFERQSGNEFMSPAIILAYNALIVNGWTVNGKLPVNIANILTPLNTHKTTIITAKCLRILSALLQSVVRKIITGYYAAVLIGGRIVCPSFCLSASYRLLTQIHLAEIKQVTLSYLFNITSPLTATHS